MKKIFFVILACVSSVCCFAQGKDYESVIRAWKDEVKEKGCNPILSTINFRTPLYFEIMKEGVNVIPWLISDYAKTEYSYEMTLMRNILKMEMLRVFDSGKEDYIYVDYPQFERKYSDYGTSVKAKKMWSGWWWNEGRKLTPQIFARKYADYQAARQTGKEEDIKAKYTLLQNMGVIILPNLLEKIEAGETDLIPMFGYLSDQKDLKTAADCRTWWDANKKRYEVILDYKQKGNEVYTPLSLSNQVISTFFANSESANYYSKTVYVKADSAVALGEISLTTEVTAKGEDWSKLVEIN